MKYLLGNLVGVGTWTDWGFGARTFDDEESNKKHGTIVTQILNLFNFEHKDEENSFFPFPISNFAYLNENPFIWRLHTFWFREIVTWGESESEILSL